MAGRPRIPTRLKLLKGTLRAHRANPNEPDVHDPQIPGPPPGLTEVEARVWERYAEVLEPMRVSTIADSMLFQSLVTSTAQMLEIEAAIRQRPLAERYTHETASRYGVTRRPQPDVVLLRAIKKEVSALATKFGLSPADRSRVSMDRPKTTGSRSKELEFGG